ncbi:hypothetical protein MMB75_16550 [Paenibacillus sp. P2(2022)]|nr:MULTISPECIES: hypothetical protein [Paenibacillus]MDG0055293.1 hypothetical protein [Paenibacillus sp. P2(2022)]MDN4076344.1 hypothetical protein [Paenibacillus polymyxa]MDN4101770.1 hypothetical protein [Paenibacillus polymyxa]MDN4111987.1 hypothetical protein [Paenibacillus polymyxa]
MAKGLSIMYITAAFSSNWIQGERMEQPEYKTLRGCGIMELENQADYSVQKRLTGAPNGNSGGALLANVSHRSVRGTSPTYRILDDTELAEDTEFAGELGEQSYRSLWHEDQNNGASCKLEWEGRVETHQMFRHSYE